MCIWVGVGGGGGGGGEIAEGECTNDYALLVLTETIVTEIRCHDLQPPNMMSIGFLAGANRDSCSFCVPTVDC